MPGAKKATPEINALLELERRDMQQPGTMPPVLKAKLEAYRKQGIVAKIGAAGGVQLTEAQGKDAAFLGRAVGAERDFQSSSFQDKPRSIAGAAAHAVLPDAVTNGFDASGRQITEQARKDFISASLRLESGAAINPDEFARQNVIFYPQPGDGPEVIAQKARARARVIEGFRVGAGPGAQAIEDKVNALYTSDGKKAPGAPGQAGAAGLRPDAPPDDGSAGGNAKITPHAVGQAVMTPEDKKFAAMAQAAFDNGASREDMDNLAKAFNRQPYGGDLDAAIEYRRKGGKGAQIQATKTGYEEPGTAQKLLAPFAASPAGAVAGGFANGATAGGLDEIAGGIQTLGGNGKTWAENTAAVDKQKQIARAAHPGEFAAGEVAGGIATSAAAGEVAGVRGAGALAPRALGMDAAYGGAYGGLENNDDRVGGALVGGLTGVAGGIAGRGVANRFAGIISPNADPNVAFLRDKGVRLTPGQSIGPTASSVEEKLMSVPGPGDLIRNGRKRALTDFNVGYLNDSLSHIGQTLPEGHAGTKAMGYAQQAFNDAYDKARSGMSLVPDTQLAADISALDQKLAAGAISGPDYDRVAKIYEHQVLRRIKNGPISGSDYKDMVSQIGKIQDTAKRSQNHELSDALGDLTATLDDAARRSSPPDAVAAMDAADKGYALFVRAEKAAAKRGGDTAEFTPSGLDSAVQAGDSSVRSKAYLRGDALGQDWAEAGKKILKDQVPDSGTAGRVALGGGAMAAGYLHPSSIAGLAGLSAAYAPGVRDVVSNVIAGDRGAVAKATADAIRNRAYLGSAVTSPLALVYQQNPPQ